MSTQERRQKPPGRRSMDVEVYEMSKQALETANEALATTKTHIAVCEQQNKDILRRLGVQDRVMWAILAGVGVELLHALFTHVVSK